MVNKETGNEYERFMRLLAKIPEDDRKQLMNLGWDLADIIGDRDPMRAQSMNDIADLIAEVGRHWVKP